MFKIQVKNGSVRDYILKYSAKRQAWRKKYFLIEDGKDNLKKIQNHLYVHEGLPRVMNVKTYSKRKTISCRKKIKIALSCNLLRIAFFKTFVKETVVAVVFLFELNLFQIFGPRNDILFSFVCSTKWYIQC